MINVKNVPIGSLVKVKSRGISILKDTNPLVRWDSFSKTDEDLYCPLLVLEYKEGIDQIHGEFTRDIKAVFCIRILVTAAEKKFWIVVNSTSNTDAINLPDDMKDSFRETGKLELIDIESN